MIEMKDVNQLLVVARIESHNVFYSLPYKIVLSIGEINVKSFFKIAIDISSHGSSNSCFEFDFDRK